MDVCGRLRWYFEVLVGWGMGEYENYEKCEKKVLQWAGKCDILKEVLFKFDFEPLKMFR